MDNDTADNQLSVDLNLNLDEIDHVILDFLSHGARTQSYMVDHSDFERHTFYNHFQFLRRVGLVENIHEKSALYELAHDPRSEDDRGVFLEKHNVDHETETEDETETEIESTNENDGDKNKNREHNYN